MKLRSKPIRAVLLVGLTLAVCAIIAPAAFAVDVNLAWTGQSDFSTWSAASNWKGGTFSPATGDSLGTLTFGNLGRSCSYERGAFTTCYFSENDVAGLNVNGINVSDNSQYDIEGGTINLGAGGITAKPGLVAASVRSRLARRVMMARARSLTARHRSPFLAPRQILELEGNVDQLSLPIVLSANQTWSVVGNGHEQEPIGIDVASISGDHPMSLDFSKDALATVDGSVETGALNLSGAGTFVPDGSINGVTGNLVTLENGAKLEFGAPGSTSGPLAVTSRGALSVATGLSPEPTLAVNGGVTFGAAGSTQLAIDEPGTKPSIDYSQITASGNVDLGSSKLDLYQGYTGGRQCESLKAKDVDTLISTTGTLTGTFAGVPNGGTVTIHNLCNFANTSATAVIRYTSDAVTATIKNGGSASKVPMQAKRPKLSGKEIEGHTLEVTRGSWTNKPTSFAYRWVRCNFRTFTCARMRKVHGRSYKLTSKDVDAAIYVVVTAKNKAGEGLAAAFTRGEVREPSRASIKLALTKLVKQDSAKLTVAALLKHDGAALSINTPSGGKLKLTWTAHAGGKKVTVASAKLDAVKAEHKKLRLKLTAGGKRLLEKAAKLGSKLSVTAKASFTPGGGKALTVTKKIKLS